MRRSRYLNRPVCPTHVGFLFGSFGGHLVCDPDTLLFTRLRFCGTTFPPDLTSSGPHMTVVFVADEGVAASGFNATYQAVSLLDSEPRPL